MYFPYLRGRQNELLCLRELLDAGCLPEDVMPVIEPVRFNSTYFLTIKRFIEAKRKVVVIKNPMVGKYDIDYKELLESIAGEQDAIKKEKKQKTLTEYKELLESPYILNALIVNDKNMNDIGYGQIETEKYVLINKDIANYTDLYLESKEEIIAKYTFIPPDEDFKEDINGAAILLRDCYNKAKRNIDYLDNPDDFFSKDHLVYKKRGYEGFSDYSIVGDEYEESGFAPLAIAIHIVYMDEKNFLKVHHFVSDSNENISDPARKFEEAMRKLVEWEKFSMIKKTMGLKALISCYENQKFPGLGVVKKYSLMHHMELIGSYLGENK
ncbi:MAG: sce7725 family protein [Lachnospiraceae bacterium]|nr:sce7725 family protein [Lachnospiraceae bacterium]